MYGGRGIRVCERWQSFEAFVDDMGEPPQGYSIDRIDGDGDYSPENCRWATPLEQQDHTRAVMMIEFNGERHCVAEWARRFGIHQNTLRGRLKRGVSMQDAIRHRLEKEHADLKETFDDGAEVQRKLA